MIQYPKLDKMSEAETQSVFDDIKNDFNALDELIYSESFPNNDYLKYFDAEAFVNYLIVYMLTGNEEINHPKSTYLYKKKGGKYCMGPIWDFDWAFGYEGTYTHFVNPTRSLFWSGTARGTIFFTRLMTDPAIGEVFKRVGTVWNNQEESIFGDYRREDSETIMESHARDQQVWNQSSGSIDKYRDKMLVWFDKRVVYMDGVAAEF